MIDYTRLQTNTVDRSVCGQCMHGEICDKYNGTCANGCKPNFKTTFCKGNYKSKYV